LSDAVGRSLPSLLGVGGLFMVPPIAAVTANSVTLAQDVPVGDKSYGWSLAIGLGDPAYKRLSTHGRDGLEWAQQLARHALVRRRAPLGNDTVPVRLTLAKIARDEGGWITAREMAGRIEQAKLELFGRRLSERAIYYRTKNRREHGTPLSNADRVCEQPRCTNPLPPSSSPHKKYCAAHDTVAARVQRHRHKQRPPSET